MEKEYKDKNYASFLALIDSYPSIKDMFNSPPPNEVDELYRKIRNHPYCKYNVKEESFEKGVEGLEILYQESKKKLDKELFELTKPFSAACREERKVRLLVRILYLLGDANTKNVVNMDLLREKIIKSLRKNIGRVQDDLEALLEDEIFLEKLNSKRQYQILTDLKGEDFGWLASFEKVGGEKLFKRAVKSNSEESTEITNYLCDRLSDAAYRLYGECSIGIMRNLLKAVYLPEIRAVRIEEIINRALEVKKEAYLKQETKESMMAWSEDEIWGYGRGYWSPQRTLAAPWFRG